MKKIIVGVLGAGRIGMVHLQAMQLQQNVEVKIVVDIYMTDTIAKTIQSLGVANISKNPDDIFKDEQIDAVFICSSTDSHYDFSMRGIQAKKHIFCEKPVDMDLNRVKEIKKHLKNTTTLYQVGFNRRFDHNFIAVKNAIQSKKIGTPQMVRITSRDPSPPPASYIKPSGGLFMDMMIHDFDMARFQIESEIEEVYAVGAVLIDKEIGKLGDIDSAVVTLQFKNGVIGYIENSRNANYGYDQRIEVLGDKGAVRIGNDAQSTMVLSNGLGVSKEKPFDFFLERYNDAYGLEQKSFFESILKKKKCVCGIDAGLESVRLAYAANKSLKEHRPVKVTEVG